MNTSVKRKIYNPSGIRRILVTGILPGSGWLDILSVAGYRTEVLSSGENLTTEEIADSIGERCTAVIGQLTEKWDSRLLGILRNAGGKAYCNYAVGYDNVDLEAATLNNIAVGNTPGVLTEATAELAVALTMACSRRINEAHEYTRHMIAKAQLMKMKTDAVLINTSRGAVIKEADLAEHCRTHPYFGAGLDVFENEPEINNDLKDLPNVTMAPHIGSATRWARENMAKLAALNIKGIIEGYPVWDGGNIEPFLGDNPPKAIPSILNRSVFR